MSRTFKSIPVPATTRTEVDKVICDLCGAETHDGNWAKSTWYYNEIEITVEISFEHRESDGGSGDGGSTDRISVDICPNCFKKKLVPWLESQGAQVKKESSYW